MENKCIEKLNEILSLNDNWNENGAKKFDKVFVNKIKSLLKYFPYEPEIFPTANNSIQFEYDLENKYLEIEFFKDKITVFIENELETQFTYDELFKVVNILKIFMLGKPKKSILFTGSFNPPTIAHYHMVHSAIRSGEFDYVIFALSNGKFLERKQKRTKDWYFSEQERLQMIFEMTAHNKNVLIYGIEQGYTYQVLKDVKEKFNCEELYFACGSDKLNEISRWGYAKNLLVEFSFYVLNRGDDEKILINKCDELFKNTHYIIGYDNEKYKDVSATKVRHLIKTKKDYMPLLETHVASYLRRKYDH